MIIEQGISLKPFNTFHIDAKARYFSVVRSEEELVNLIEEERPAEKNPLVLGGGSNMLLTKDYDGFVIKNEVGGIEVTAEDEDVVYVKAGGGVNWHQFVLYCVANGYAGAENLSLIPGNVGASPIQNIGAYGVEIKDIFHELEAVHLREATRQVFSLEDCAFGYRDSVFKNKYKGQFMISSVSFRLSKKPQFNTSYGAIQAELHQMGVQELSIAAISQAVINIRSSKLPDPAVIGNAGSFFKNPVVTNSLAESIRSAYPSLVSFPAGEHSSKLAAGWLIEQCGWKGFRRGDAGCYPKQALVLVNYGSATGAEVLQLSAEIIDSVREKFEVVLEREVNII